MKKLLVIVDMQNDFVTGALGSEQALQIVPKIKARIQEYRDSGNTIIYTQDTHQENYLETMEGKYLPVEHCIKGTFGWEIVPELIGEGVVFEKPTFGSLELTKEIASWGYDEIEFVGTCTAICVASNALILKAQLPETRIIVDASCCACVNEESHNAALLTMQMCQIDILNWRNDK